MTAQQLEEHITEVDEQLEESDEKCEEAVAMTNEVELGPNERDSATKEEPEIEAEEDRIIVEQSPSQVHGAGILSNPTSLMIYPYDSQNVSLVPTVDGANHPAVSFSINRFTLHPEQCPGTKILGLSAFKSLTVASICATSASAR